MICVVFKQKCLKVKQYSLHMVCKKVDYIQNYILRWINIAYFHRAFYEFLGFYFCFLYFAYFFYFFYFFYFYFGLISGPCNDVIFFLVAEIKLPKTPLDNLPNIQATQNPIITNKDAHNQSRFTAC